MLKNTLSRLRLFWDSRDGNFAITTGLLIIPVLVTSIGLSVDYSSATNERSNMQNALDAAAWELGRLDPELALDVKRAKIQQFYAANGGKGTVAVDEPKITKTHVSLSVSATYDNPTTVMSMVGAGSVRITASAAVRLPYRLTEATFSVTKQSGWWAKTIRLYGRVEGETKYRQLMRLVYGGKVVGSSVMNKNYKYVTNQKTWLESEVTDTNVKVDLKNIDSLYMEMTIDAPDGSIKEAFFGDKDSRSTLVFPKVIQSDDPKYVSRMYITKENQVTQNANTDIYSRLGCDETEKHSWEDGGSLKASDVTTGSYTTGSGRDRKTITIKTSTLIEGVYGELGANPTAAQKAAVSDFDYVITGRCNYTTGAAYMTN